MSDELGYYEPGFMGGQNIGAPNLDRMAAEGLRFNNGSQLDFPEFHGGEDGLKPVAKDAGPGPEATALFAHNERVMRRYIESLGFSWAKHIYPENMKSSVIQGARQ